jgi:hypothetical protein
MSVILHAPAATDYVGFVRAGTSEKTRGKLVRGIRRQVASPPLAYTTLHLAVCRYLIAVQTTPFMQRVHSFRFYITADQPLGAHEKFTSAQIELPTQKSRPSHVAQGSSTRFIIHAGGVQVVEQVRGNIIIHAARPRVRSKDTYHNGCKMEPARWATFGEQGWVILRECRRISPSLVCATRRLGNPKKHHTEQMRSLAEVKLPLVDAIELRVDSGGSWQHTNIGSPADLLSTVLTE